MQYPQSEKVQNQHQPDNNKYQPQLVGTSCLDSSVATSEANYPQSDNKQNQHCSGQQYPHLNIRTSKPQQVDTSHQESSTSREDLDSTSNRQVAIGKMQSRLRRGCWNQIKTGLTNHICSWILGLINRNRLILHVKKALMTRLKEKS